MKPFLPLRGSAACAGAFGMVISCSAQVNCVVTDKVDEFTRQREVNVSMDQYHAGPRYEWHALNDRCSLRLHWRTEDRGPAVVTERDPLLIRLENDSVLVLFSDSTVAALPRIDRQGRSYTEDRYSYAVDMRQLKLLGHGWVQKLRIQFTTGISEHEAFRHVEWQIGFERSARCFLEALTHEPADPINVVVGPPAAVAP